MRFGNGILELSEGSLAGNGARTRTDKACAVCEKARKNGENVGENLIEKA